MKTKAAEKPLPAPIRPAVTSDEPPLTSNEKRPVGRPPSAACGVTMEDIMRRRFDEEWRALEMNAKIDAAMKAYLAMDPTNTREMGLAILFAEIDRRKEEIQRSRCRTPSS